MTQNPDDQPGRPRLRAGDSERQQASETLTRAWRQGRITREEFQKRSQESFSATYLDELDALVADLGGLGGLLGPNDASYQVPVAALSTPDELAVRDAWRSEPDDNLPAVRYAPEGSRGSALSVGVMGGVDKAGQWVVAPNHVTIGVMGGTTLDLRDALFISPETTIICIAIMGGVEVIVPPEMDVHVSGIGFMGGFGWDRIDQARPAVAPTAGNPRVQITGLGFMGGVGVTRRERGQPARVD